jgi:hypothetical protein
MGPPPNPQQRRTDRGLSAAAQVRLPAAGRKGRPPTWPLEAEPKDAERALWSRLWHTPQAVAWDRFEWSRVVARYVRVVLEAESELDSKLLAEARQLEDRLGLNPMAMLRLRWEVDADEVAAQRQARPAGQDGDRRARVLKAVNEE